jgi:hypoxanthine phosphoribosyltransferase
MPAITSPTVLIGEDELQARIAALAHEIRQDLPSEQIHLVCVLKGAFLFLGDLIRNMDGHLTIDFMACSSYGAAT